MIEKLFTYVNIIIDRIQIREAFYMILYMSIFAVIVGFTIFLIQEIFDKKISPKWKVIMWGIFILSLIIPFNVNGIYESNNIFMKILNPIQEISFKQEVDERQAEYNTYIQNGGTDLLPVNEETCEIFFKTHSDFNFVEEIEESQVYGLDEKEIEKE